MNAPGLLSTAQVADLVGVKPSTIRGYAARGQMPPASGRFGREPYWTLEAVTQWIDARNARRATRPGGADR